MQPVRTLTGCAASVPRANIDTDQIIPAGWMKRVGRTGYQDALFQRWREDPEFVLNDPDRQAATILLAGPNFGCGSSRQHAVWALRDWGIRAVISTQIADIHRANLPTEGLVPVEVSAQVLDRLMQATDANARTPITIDVDSRILTCAAANIFDEPFNLDDASHYSLLNGYDPIDLTMRHADIIGAYEDKRAPWLPRGTANVSNVVPSDP